MVEGDRQVLAEKPAQVGELRFYRLEAMAKGNVLKVQLDGQELVNAVDDTFTAGKAALWVGEDASVYFQDMRAVYGP